MGGDEASEMGELNKMCTRKRSDNALRLIGGRKTQDKCETCMRTIKSLASLRKLPVLPTTRS